MIFIGRIVGLWNTRHDKNANGRPVYDALNHFAASSLLCC
jgi:hypothetical protein